MIKQPHPKKIVSDSFISRHPCHDDVEWGKNLDFNPIGGARIFSSAQQHSPHIKVGIIIVVSILIC